MSQKNIHELHSIGSVPEIVNVAGEDDRRPFTGSKDEQSLIRLGKRPVLKVCMALEDE